MNEPNAMAVIDPRRAVANIKWLNRVSCTIVPAVNSNMATYSTGESRKCATISAPTKNAVSRFRKRDQCFLPSRGGVWSAISA